MTPSNAPRARLVHVLAGLAALVIVSLVVGVIPGLSDRWRAEIETVTKGGKKQPADTTGVTGVAYALPDCIWDISLGDGGSADLRRFIPAIATGIPGILDRSAVRVKLGGPDTLRLRIGWDMDVKESALSLTLYDALERPVGAWSGTSGASDINLAPGLYKLSYSASGALGKAFRFDLRAARTGEAPVSPAAAGYSIPVLDMVMSESMYISWDEQRSAIAAKLQSQDFLESISFKRVTADIVTGSSRTTAQLWDAGVGDPIHFSASTPSFTGRVISGPLLFGISRFKLYSIRTQEGIFNQVIYSVLYDEGIFIPRTVLAELNLNGRKLGPYLLVEIPDSDAFFSGAQRYDGELVGTRGNVVKPAPAAGMARQPEMVDLQWEPDIASITNSKSFSKGIALLAAFQGTHGTQESDFRLYRNPYLDKPEPVLRDINAGTQSADDLSSRLRAFLSHGNWFLWPRAIGIGSNINPKLFPDYSSTNAYVMSPWSIPMASVHPAIIQFIKDSGNIELFDQGLIYASSNEIRDRVAGRMQSLFDAVRPYLDAGGPRPFRGFPSEEAWLASQVKSFSQDGFVIPGYLPVLERQSALLLVEDDVQAGGAPASSQASFILYNLSPFSSRISLPDYVTVKDLDGKTIPAGPDGFLISPSQMFSLAVPLSSATFPVDTESYVPDKETAQNLVGFELLRYRSLPGLSAATATPFLEVSVPVTRRNDFNEYLSRSSVSRLAGAYDLPASRNLIVSSLAGHSQLQVSQDPGDRRIDREFVSKAGLDLDPVTYTARESAVKPVIDTERTFDGFSKYMSTGLDVSAWPRLMVSLKAWFDPIQVDKLATLLDFNHAVKANAVLQAEPDGPGYYRLYWICAGQAVGARVPAGEWVTIAVVADRSAMTSVLYINGKMAGSLKFQAEPYGTDARLTVGRWEGGPGRYFRGSLKELYVLSSELKTSLITAESVLPAMAEAESGDVFRYDGRTNFVKTRVDASGWPTLSVSLRLRIEPGIPGATGIVADFNHTADKNAVLQVNYGQDKSICDLNWICAGQTITARVGTGKWLSIVAFADRGRQEMLLYVDGILAGRNFINVSPYGANAIPTFGRFARGEGRYFKGEMSEIIISSRFTALDIADLATLKQTGSAPDVVVLPLRLETGPAGARLQMLVSNVSTAPVTLALDKLGWRDPTDNNWIPIDSGAVVTVPSRFVSARYIGGKQEGALAAQVMLGPAGERVSFQEGLLGATMNITGALAGVLAGPASTDSPNSCIVEYDFPSSHYWAQTDAALMARDASGPGREVKVVVHEPFLFRLPVGPGPARLPGFHSAADIVKVTASDSAKSSPPSLASDGNNDTFWMAGDKRQSPSWLSFDFGRPITLEAVAVLPKLGNESFWSGDLAHLEASSSSGLAQRWQRIASLPVDTARFDQGAWSWLTYDINAAESFRYFRLVVDDPAFGAIAEVAFKAKELDRSAPVLTLEQLVNKGVLVLDASAAGKPRGVRFADKNALVGGVVLVPSGYELHVEPGTNLKFSKGAGILSYSPIVASGSPASPVTFSPVDDKAGWAGIAVVDATGPSRFENVVMKGAAGGWMGEAQFSGGLTFMQTRVVITDTLLDAFSSEDGLHLPYSSFDITRLTIHNSRSDALDTDWGNGTITGSSFTSLTGDGVDISGAYVRVIDCVMQGCGDKGISVGEGAVADIDGVKLLKNKTGVAIKDQSVVHLSNSLITGNERGLLRYIKKPVFIYPELYLSNVDIRDNGTNVIEDDHSTWTRRFD